MTATLKEPKKQRFAARISVADKELFRKAAAIEGRSLAQFMIAHAREIAHQVVAQSQQIQLNAAQSRQFVEAVLAPPRSPSTALKQAMAHYRRQVREV